MISAKLWLVAGLLVIILLIALFISYSQTRPVVTPIVTPKPSTPESTPFNTPQLTITPRTSISPLPSGSPTSRTPTPTYFPSPSPVILYPGEVRQYEGQNLSSIADIYENAIAGTQYLNPENYTLTVSGLVNKTLTLSYDQVLAGRQFYQKVVTIFCVEGWNATILWDGILVKDLLQEAEPNSSANTVVFHASDGYTTALPLDYLYAKNIVLAFKMNGYILPAERGFPFQLVAESKYGYKWVKWITGIELTNNPGYLGYWESYGYSNDASIP